MKSLPMVAIIACMFTAQGVCAVELPYPKHVFDATYEVTDSDNGKYTMRIASDGNGHVLIVRTNNGGKTTNISDYKKNLTVVLLDATKRVIRVPMTTMKAALPTLTDVENPQKAGAKLLGRKTIDGHPCKGFETSEGGATTQTWIGDDTNYMVHAAAISPTYKAEMALKAWSPKAPSPDEFKVPAGYEELAVN